MNSFYGETTSHKVYGKGIIKKIEGDKVSVDFNGTQKIFKFPDAFEKFLTFDNPNVQASVRELIKEKQKQISDEATRVEKQREVLVQRAMQTKKDKRNTRTTPHREFLTKGEIFSTHKDVLNECFGFQYEHFQPAMKVVDDQFSVWFPSIAKVVHDEFIPSATSNGWINVLSENDTVLTEKNEDATKNIERESKYDLDRFVFAKFDDQSYRFIGIFRPEHAIRPWETGYKYRLIGTKVNLKTMVIL